MDDLESLINEDMVRWDMEYNSLEKNTQSADQSSSSMNEESHEETVQVSMREIHESIRIQMRENILYEGCSRHHAPVFLFLL